jgi:hypothetical protein
MSPCRYPCPPATRPASHSNKTTPLFQSSPPCWNSQDVQTIIFCLRAHGATGHHAQTSRKEPSMHHLCVSPQLQQADGLHVPPLSHALLTKPISVFLPPRQLYFFLKSTTSPAMAPNLAYSHSTRKQKNFQPTFAVTHSLVLGSPCWFLSLAFSAVL